MYAWQHPEWPRWSVDGARLLPACTQFADRHGALRGRLETIGLDLSSRHQAEVLGDDAASTAKVEGETLPPSSLRSSIVRRLGLERVGFEMPQPHRRDERVEGLLEVLEDATLHSQEPLTHERLHRWHQRLFAEERVGQRLERIGAYRSSPIEVLSGSVADPRVHFEAPPADRVPEEMERFIAWWNRSADQDPAITAGLAHLWFETIHPFEDGNGRIGRAIADLTLSRADRQPRRAFSLSRQILEDQDAYYQALESAQRLPSSPRPNAPPPLDATPWLEWFVPCLTRAVLRAEHSLHRAILRHHLTQSADRLQLNPRQQKALERLIEAEPDGLIGDLTNRKYRSLTQTSDATASRDLADLLAKQLLTLAPSRGRSTAYRLNPAALR